MIYVNIKNKVNFEDFNNQLNNNKVNNNKFILIPYIYFKDYDKLVTDIEDILEINNIADESDDESNISDESDTYDIKYSDTIEDYGVIDNIKIL